MDSMVQLLRRVGADLVDSEGKNILFHAASEEYNDDKYTYLLRILLEHGVPPESANPLIYLKPFIAVLKNGDLSAVQLMMSHGIELENYKNELPLHVAAHNPRLEVLRFLLSTKIFDLNEINGLGQTALFDAVEAKNPEALELLLDSRLDPNFVDNENYMPLHRVDYSDETEATTKCVEILLRHGADPDAKVVEGLTAMNLALAAEHHFQETIRLRLLIEYGAGQRDEGAMYHVLKTLIMSGDLETLKVYIKQRNIDLFKCKEKWSLSFALSNSQVAVLEFLLNSYEGVFDVTRNNWDKYILHKAVMSYNPEAAELLLDWGVEVDFEYSIDGFAPLHLAASRVDVEHPGGGTKYVTAKCIEVLFLHGAGINRKCFDGQTALEMAIPRDITSWSELPEISPGAMSILAQANLLESQGKPLDSQNLHRREAENKQCQDELKALKAEILGDSVTLYTILANGTSRFYSKKSELMQKLNDCEYVRSLENRFPIYGRRLVKIIEHVNLKETAAERVSRLVGFQRDNFYLIVEKIVRMLFVRDLRTLNML